MSEQFEPRAAAKGAEVSVIVGNEERTLKAKAHKGGHAITPADAAEAAALERFSDEALNPPEPSGQDVSTRNDSDAGDGEGDQA